MDHDADGDDDDDDDDNDDDDDDNDDGDDDYNGYNDSNNDDDNVPITNKGGLLEVSILFSKSKSENSSDILFSNTSNIKN